jgi:hypothetical protein
LNCYTHAVPPLILKFAIGILKAFPPSIFMNTDEAIVIVPDTLDKVIPSPAARVIPPLNPLM